VPLVQGTLRYAYKQSVSGFADETEIIQAKEKAEGAIFAAAVLPQVYACDTSKAQTIYNNMKLSNSGPVNFAAVKAAFEACYGPMGITCALVGGLLNDDGTYKPNAQPCSPQKPDVSITFQLTVDGAASEWETLSAQAAVKESVANEAGETVSTFEVTVTVKTVTADARRRLQTTSTVLDIDVAVPDADNSATVDSALTTAFGTAEAATTSLQKQPALSGRTVTAVVPPTTTENRPTSPAPADDGLETGAIVGIVVASAVAAALLIFLLLVISKERQGVPMFVAVGTANEANGGAKETGKSSASASAGAPENV